MTNICEMIQECVDTISISKEVILPLFIEFFGAFLGLISALWLSNHNLRKKRKELDLSLKEELKVIHDELGKRKEQDVEDYYRYATPVWNINLRSGTFNELEYTKYNQFISIYSKIEYAQEIEREWSHSKLIDADFQGEKRNTFRERYIEAMNKERKRMCSEIYNEISKLL